jgi:hypothetical protein
LADSFGLAARGETVMLRTLSGTSMTAGFGLWTGFASFTGTLAFATGFFLAGVFVAMADPAPRFHIKQLKKVRHS